MKQSQPEAEQRKTDHLRSILAMDYLFPALRAWVNLGTPAPGHLWTLRFDEAGFSLTSLTWEQIAQIADAPSMARAKQQMQEVPSAETWVIVIARCLSPACLVVHAHPFAFSSLAEADEDEVDPPPSKRAQA